MIHFLLFLFVLGINWAEACTAFQLKSQDGAYLYCRSMEYGYDLESNLLIVSRGTEYAGTALDGPGLKWKTKYGFVGMNQAVARNLVSDGMNEKGLVVGGLYLPVFAKYEAPDPKKVKRTLGSWELSTFLLGTCESVEEVKKILPTILVGQFSKPDFGDFILPLHFYICDGTGEVAIVEYTDGMRHVYDNPLGTLTNSPTLDWQLLNLNRYINLSPVNAPDQQLSDWTLKNMGEGSGLLGLPGDYTPSSRFVRAALFSQWAAGQSNSLDAVRMGFHILNTFDIFEGIIRKTPDEKKRKTPLGKAMPEITQWVVVHDRVNLKTYWRSYGSLQIQMADLNKIDFTKPGLHQIQMDDEFTVEDVTNRVEALEMRSK